MRHAGKAPVDRSEARKILSGVRTLYATRGKKVVSFNLEGAPLGDDALSPIFGRTGKLRAPSIRAGTVFVAGFNEALYERLFASDGAQPEKSDEP